jgi:hypothetical protein
MTTIRRGAETGTRKKGSNKIIQRKLEPRLEEEEEQVISIQPQVEGAEAGRALLSMLRSTEPAISAGIASEPQPLSKDEFLLGELEAREDRELGADRHNAQTFGDGAGAGWSFEENVAANERLEANFHPTIHQSSPALQHRLAFAILHMSTYVDIKPAALKRVFQRVLVDGWDNITWRNSYTALHLAAEMGVADIMPLFVVLGAEPATMDNKGRTARDVAHRRQNTHSDLMLGRIQRCHRLEEVVGELPPIFESMPHIIAWKNGSEPEPEPRDSVGMVALIAKMTECDRLKLALWLTMKLLNLEPACFEAVLQLALSHRNHIGLGSTALHLLVEFCRDDLIPLAVSLGASVYQVDELGRTPYELSMLLKRPACMAALACAMEKAYNHSMRAAAHSPQPGHHKLSRRGGHNSTNVLGSKRKRLDVPGIGIRNGCVRMTV